MIIEIGKNLADLIAGIFSLIFMGVILFKFLS